MGEKLVTGDDECKDANEPSAYVLRLFISGASPNSTRAVYNIRQVCEKYLPGRYQLDIIDVHQQPVLAREEQVIALPLLVKLSPEPKRRLIGDMSNTAKVLSGLGITIS
ncbi:circadian clock KaiB family protein [Hufsiella ginkgonis]|uniref:Circadian clock protein KaiB n=1 Tax=Hufsiella ginkgonis TaxID=2695274 RepID=A0A7K1XUU0_9SPHI|nr:circadian clock KaiB family protein [Hufsiella ginkgonis]MXV14256.1 circadian clock protein KaiB [Hufsiella ginkgonis]